LDVCVHRLQVEELEEKQLLDLVLRRQHGPAAFFRKLSQPKLSKQEASPWVGYADRRAAQDDSFARGFDRRGALLDMLFTMLRALISAFRSQRAPAVENLALRRQLTVLQ
jgi:hypothetical protein